MNKHGGIDPFDKKAEKRAKKTDLITLPEKVEGTNCSNCKFVEILDKDAGMGMCVNPKVLQPVTKRMCCALWDNKEVERPWKKKE